MAVNLNIDATLTPSTEYSFAIRQYLLEYSVVVQTSEIGVGNTSVSHSTMIQMIPSDHQDLGKTEKADVAATADAPFVAKLVTPAARTDDLSPAGENTAGETPSILAADPSIRVGSPFRQDPDHLPSATVPLSLPGHSGEAAYSEFGAFRYTAIGASSAAVTVLLFAAVGAWWFPAGGALVAVLGTVLSIVGLFSTKRFRIVAIAALPLHISLFFLSYARSLV